MLSLTALACDPPAPDAIVDYERDVRPILSEHCFGCHGPDEEGREADLRLDTFEGATAVREDGRRAIVPRSPEQSVLVERVRHGDPMVRMPPEPRSALSSAQIAMLERWIRQGATYQRHWAFRRPTRPEPPAGGNAVDAFIDARLAAEGVSASPRAAPHVLIRRLYLDLTGLPPTPDEVAAFEADPSEAAYLAIVERLLDSPAHAEQLTRDWLDYVGYGDSTGMYLDLERTMWPYRDWVLDGFARHRPLDQMIVAQLAGDLLPSATNDDVLATAMLRLHPTSEEGGVNDEEYRIRYATDRATLVGTQFLGLTVHCARCHDHKYDPIPHDDFYRLTACFNRTRDFGESIYDDPFLDAPSPLSRRELSEWTAERDRRRGVLNAMDRDGAVTAFEATLGGAVSFASLRFLETTAERGALLSQDAGGTVTASGPIDLADTYHLRAAVSDDVRVVRFELGRGRGSPPVLSEITVWHETTDARRTLAVADAFFADGASARAAVDGSTTTSIPVATPSTLFVVLDETLLRDPAATLTLRIDQYDGRSAVFETIAVSTSTSPRATFTPAVADAFARPAAARSADEQELLRAHVARHFADAPIRAAARELALAEAEVARLGAVPRVRVMRDDDPGRRTSTLRRGNFDDPLREVSCGAPVALTIDDVPEISNRLDLARWIVGPTHPTSGRVLANHYFRFVFGRELLVTDGTTDFGVRGGRASHPELLDWLAVDLADGWDLRAFLRLLVTSQAYQRSSSARPDLSARDADGRLFARAWSRRLDAEVIRDQALFAGGLLVSRVGGPSVRPYHPEGLYEELGRGYGDMFVYRPDRSTTRIHRRSLYTFWRRVTLLPSIALLDGPSRVTSISRRSETNTPTQALALLHEPLLVEAARALAERMASEGGADPNAQITFAFRALVARAPTAAELTVLRNAYDAELAAGADETLSVGESDRSSGGDVQAHRARTHVARVILNTSETLTRE